jgi:hypothetical protein
VVTLVVTRKLTKRVVDASTAKAERFIVWDAELKGFGLLVLPSRVKSYIYKYRTGGGQRRATIGQHGAWTADQARRKAEDMRHVIRSGGDPLGIKRALLDEPTVGDILDDYLVSEVFKDKAESTQGIDRGRIERHLRPLLGRRHAYILTDNDIRRAIVAIRDGKTAANVKTRKRGLARATRTPPLANRSRWQSAMET